MLCRIASVFSLAVLVGGLGVLVDAADEEAPKFNKCNDDGDTTDLPRLQSRTIKLKTEKGKASATYAVDWEAEDNIDGALLEDDKTTVTFTPGKLSFDKSLKDDAGNEARCELTIEVTDNEQPVILCPENVTMTTELQPTGGSIKLLATLADLEKSCKSILKTLDTMPDENTETTCKIYAADNVKVVSIEPGGQSAKLKAGEYSITFTAEDDAGNKKKCASTLFVEDSKDGNYDAESLSLISSAAAFATASLRASETTPSKRTAYLEDVFEALGRYADTAFKNYLQRNFLAVDTIDQIAAAVRRLAVPTGWKKALTFADHAMLVDCVSLIQKKRMWMSNKQASELLAARCGDDTCASRVEDCNSCPSDCGACNVAVSLRYFNQDYEYTPAGGEAQVESPMIVVGEYAPVPLGFGPTTITVDAYKWPTPNRRFGVEVKALSRAEVSSHSLTKSAYLDPQSKFPKNFQFAGATFVVERTTTQGVTPLKLKVKVEMKDIGRWIPPAAAISLWYATKGEWKQCYDTSGLDSSDVSNIVYEGFLDDCHGDQLALFSDRSAGEMYAVEENVVAILDESVLTPDAKAFDEVPRVYNTLINEQIILELERCVDLVAYHRDAADVGLFGQLTIVTETFAVNIQKTTYGSLKESGTTIAMPDTLDGQPGTTFVLAKDTRWDQVASMHAEGETTTAATTTFAQTTVAAATTADPNCGATYDCEFEDNTSFEGLWGGDDGDGEVKVDDQKACCDLCSETEECNYFTFVTEDEPDPDNRQQCLMITKWLATSTQAHRYAGVDPLAKCQTTSTSTTTTTTTTELPAAFTDDSVAVIAAWNVDNVFFDGKAGAPGSKLVDGQLSRLLIREDANPKRGWGRTVNVNALKTQVSITIPLPDFHLEADHGTDDTCAEYVQLPNNESHWNVTNGVTASALEVNATVFECLSDGFGFYGLWSVDATTQTTTGTSTLTSTATTTQTSTPTTSLTSTDTSTARVGFTYLGPVALWILLMLLACCEKRRFSSLVFKLEDERHKIAALDQDQLVADESKLTWDLMARPLGECCSIFFLTRLVSNWVLQCLSRSAICIAISPRTACCTVRGYPKRWLAIIYLIGSGMFALGVLSSLNLTRYHKGWELPQKDVLESWPHWKHDALHPAVAFDDAFEGSGEAVEFVAADVDATTETSTTTTETTTTTIRPWNSTVPVHIEVFFVHNVPVKGIFDGLWCYALSIPYMVLLAYAIGKYRGYTDVLRLLAPRRYHATFSRAYKTMLERGLPVDEWILTAKYPEREGAYDVSDAGAGAGAGFAADVGGGGVGVSNDAQNYDNHPNFVDKEPGGMNPMYGGSNAGDRHGSPVNNKFFDDANQGYLQVNEQDLSGLRGPARDMMEDAIERADDREGADGLGWGNDSVVGDLATSGAGNAKAVDLDSLFDLDEFSDPLSRDLSGYRPDFSSKFEDMVRIIKWWWICIIFLLVLAVLFGSMGIFILFLREDLSHHMTDYEAMIFSTGFVLFAVFSFAVVPFLAVLYYGCHRTFFAAPVHPDDNTVKTPDCENTCLYNATC